MSALNVIPLPCAHSEAGGWSARLDLEIIRSETRTELGRRIHHGPLRIQRPFYPEGNAILHLYLLHPPGGMVGGDRLDVALELGSEASALITTPSAQKLYRSRGPRSTQEIGISVGRGACLEWLPAETLIFDAANAKLSTRVELREDAAFIGWELGCFGRPAGNLPFVRGHFSQSFEIYREGSPLLVERVRVEGGSDVLSAPWGYAGATSYGTLYAVPRTRRSLAELVARLRASPLFSEPDRVSVTELDELLVVRARGPSIEWVRRPLIEAWGAARQGLLGRAACVPRIWAT